jgi:hypothetical protein
MPNTDIQEITVLATDTGDHDVFAHYAEKDLITEAMINGTPIVALCGKIWVPFRDPSKYPVCPTCDEIIKNMPPGGPPSK